MHATVADSHNPVLPPWGDDARVIGLVGLAHASSHFGHMLLPLCFTVFTAEFGLSYAQLGLLMTVFFVVSGVVQALSGFAVDRFGARVLLWAALALFALASLGAALAQGYHSLLLVAALAGLGNASFHPVDFTILNQRVSSARLGHAFSAHGITGNLGWAAAPVFFAGLGAAWGWRGAYLGAALLYLGLLALMVWQRRALHTEVLPRQAGGGGTHGLAFMRSPIVWWCFGFFLLSTMAFAVIQSFAVPILRTVHQVSFEVATATLTAYMLCGALGMLVGGFVAARVRRSDRVVALALTGGAALLALCASGWLGSTWTLVALASTGFSIGIGGPSRDLLVKAATPKGATGRVYGLVYSGLDTGLALSPVLFGLLMDRGWYAATLGGAAFILLCAVATAWRVGQGGRRAPAAA